MQQKSCQIHYGSDCQKCDARENLENQLGGTSVSSYICFIIYKSHPCGYAHSTIYFSFVANVRQGLGKWKVNKLCAWCTHLAQGWWWGWGVGVVGEIPAESCLRSSVVSPQGSLICGPCQSLQRHCACFKLILLSCFWAACFVPTPPVCCRVSSLLHLLLCGATEKSPRTWLQSSSSSKPPTTVQPSWQPAWHNSLLRVLPTSGVAIFTGMCLPFRSLPGAQIPVLPGYVEIFLAALGAVVIPNGKTDPELESGELGYHWFRFPMARKMHA